jgi:hypothetical protein
MHCADIIYLCLPTFSSVSYASRYIQLMSVTFRIGINTECICVGYRSDYCVSVTILNLREAQNETFEISGKQLVT